MENTVLYYGDDDGKKLLLIGVICIGQPLLNLEKSAHFLMLESLSITSQLVHYYDKKKKGVNK